MVMGLSSLSVLFAVMVGYIHHQSLMDREVPNWLRYVGGKLNRILLVHPRRKGGGGPAGGGKDSSTAETTPEPKQAFSYTDNFTNLNLTFKNDMDVDHTPNHRPKALQAQQTYVTKDGGLKLANSTKEGMRLANSTGFRTNHSPGVTTPLLSTAKDKGSGCNSKKCNSYNHNSKTTNSDASAGNSACNPKSVKGKCSNKDREQNSPKVVKCKDVPRKSHQDKDLVQFSPQTCQKEGHHSLKPPTQKPETNKETVQNIPKTNHSKSNRKDKQVKLDGRIEEENIPLQARESRECHECKLFKQAREEALQGCLPPQPPGLGAGRSGGEGGAHNATNCGSGEQARPNPAPAAATAAATATAPAPAGNSAPSPAATAAPNGGGTRSRKRCERHYEQQEEILKRLSLLLLRQEELLKPGVEEVNKEWHEIAEVVDRCFFWFYLTMTLGVTIVILVLVPLGKVSDMTFPPNS